MFNINIIMAFFHAAKYGKHNGHQIPNHRIFTVHCNRRLYHSAQQIQHYCIDIIRCRSEILFGSMVQQFKHIVHNGNAFGNLIQFDKKKMIEEKKNGKRKERETNKQTFPSKCYPFGPFGQIKSNS